MLNPDNLSFADAQLTDFVKCRINNRKLSMGHDKGQAFKVGFRVRYASKLLQLL